MTDTVRSYAFVTYARDPFGLTATEIGFLPTLMLVGEPAAVAAVGADAIRPAVSRTLSATDLVRVARARPRIARCPLGSFFVVRLVCAGLPG
ncbi:hypothetical protein ACQPZF_11915 [Actinosynnema sp. CS-041913]|uniref:hypothetical protein n=1 Tax=Actinosynnema sp. CS-041913 TaxID=3239917 RepID=UPI003D8CDE11